MLNKVAEYHQDWLNIANSFLNNKQDAEDLVQDMYIKLHNLNITYEKIRYKDQVNKYYIYQTLRNMALSFLKNKATNYQLNGTEIEDETYCPKDEALDTLIERLHNEIDTWCYYDKNLFLIYMYSGLSFRDISYGCDKEIRKIAHDIELDEKAVKRGTKISVTSIFHSIKKLKEILIERFGEDFEDYINNDFEKI